MLFAAALLLCLAGVCSAQESRGSITGKVMDPQNAVVPGTTVTITNRETNVSNRATTNQTGYFEVNFLDPGTYSISAEAIGFKKLVRSGIVLNTGDRLAVDLPLDIGESTQTVEVTADVPLLETTNAAGGRVLDNRDMSQLPYTTMNPLSLQAITPGVVFTGTPGVMRVLDNKGAGTFDTNGFVTNGGNEFLMDGAPVTGTTNGAAGFIPSSEAVAETRIETAPFDAASGHTAGASVSLTIKSGTNTYHGSVFEQIQQNRWNATPHFTRLSYQAGIANGTIAPGTPKQPSGKFSQPGFSIGGPVRIPKLYNGSNRFFFYLNVSKITQISTSRFAIYSVPTAAERAGDFSALLPVNPVAYTVYDPRSAAMVNGHVTRTPFPGNKGIPVLNPAYDFYSKTYPLPNNVPGVAQSDGTNNWYDQNQPYIDHFKSVINRFDFNINDKQRLNAKWYFSRRDGNGYDWGHSTSLAGLQSNGELRRMPGGSGDYIYAFNANNVLDVGVSLTRYNQGYIKPILTKYKAADLGLPAYVDAKAGAYDDLPAFTLAGFANTAGGTTAYPGLRQSGTTAQLTVKMATIHGAHTLKYGLDERRYWYATVTPGGYPTGMYTFDNAYMKQADNTNTASNLGLSWAAFMMGLPTGVSLDTNDTGYFSTPTHALYIQDDFRLSSRLRIGLGLRFEREAGISERFNRGLTGAFDSGFQPAYAQAVQAAYAAKPIAQLPASQFVVAGGATYLGPNNHTWTNGRNRFLPNASMVYQINGKTVLRLGTGWFSDTFNAMSNRPLQNGYSQATNTTVSSDLGLTFCCGVGAASGLSASANPMKDPFPVRADGTRFSVPYGNSLGSDILDGQSYTYYPRDYSPALQQRWRASFQRQIAADQSVDVSYNGAYAANPMNLNLSYLPAQYWAFGNTRNNAVDSAMTAAVANPFNIANFSSMAQSNPKLYAYLRTIPLFSATTVQTQALLRAYPNMNSGLTEAGGLRAKNWYHDLQFLYSKRFSRGFQSSVMYTRSWSREQWQPNQFDPSLAWSPGSNARPSRFVWTTVWELPFGKGRHWLKQGPLQHVVGGWQVSWVYQYQTGPLISWSNLFYYGSLDQLVSTLNHDKVHSQNIHLWFDPNVAYNPAINPSYSATGAVPAGFVGFEGRSAFQPGTYQARVFPRYIDSLRADAIRNWDTKIYRRFTLYERLNLNASLDLMNMTNHTQFNAPGVNPTSTTFGQVSGGSTESQGNAPRLIQLNLKIEF
jgi:hypothetical protein